MALVYVNGTLLSKQTGSTPSAAWGLAFAGADGVAIGRAHPMSAPFGYLSGRLDELSVWNRGLSAAEVSTSVGRTCAERVNSSMACYSFDAAVNNNLFADSGGGPPSSVVAVTEDKFAPWCSTRGDGGQLFVSANKVCSAYAESWGFCTERAHLPGLGFDYNEDELSTLNMVLRSASSPSVDLLVGMLGCVNTPLVLDGNVAGR
jgi:hypothetical protein